MGHAVKDCHVVFIGSDIISGLGPGVTEAQHRDEDQPHQRKKSGGEPAPAFLGEAVVVVGGRLRLVGEHHRRPSLGGALGDDRNLTGFGGKGRGTDQYMFAGEQVLPDEICADCDLRGGSGRWLGGLSRPAFASGGAGRRKRCRRYRRYLRFRVDELDHGNRHVVR